MRKFLFIVIGYLATFFGSQLLFAIIDPNDNLNSTIFAIILMSFFIILWTLLIILWGRLFPKQNKSVSGATTTSENYTQNTHDIALPYSKITLSDDQDDLIGILVTASVKFQWSNEFVLNEPAKGTIKFFFSEKKRTVMFDYTLKSRSLRATVGETIPMANLHLVKDSLEGITIEFRNPDSSKTTLKIIPRSVSDALRISSVFSAFNESKEKID